MRQTESADVFKLHVTVKVKFCPSVNPDRITGSDLMWPHYGPTPAVGLCCPSSSGEVDPAL